MPELPEVQTVVNTLQPLVGKRFERLRVMRKDVIHGERTTLQAFAKQRTILSIHRAAKRIVIDLGDEKYLQFHLGMTGQLTVKPRSTPKLAHTHICMQIAECDDELRFRDVRRFGGVWLLTPNTPRHGRGLGKIGLDPLSMSYESFDQLLTHKRQVKALLLDQPLIAGLGNIYADESLFRSKIHPLQIANELPARLRKTLYREIRATLQEAIDAGGSTISDYRTPNGENGWFQLNHQAYGRTGEPCKRCKTPIERIQAAGRSSHVCPRCQSL